MCVCVCVSVCECSRGDVQLQAVKLGLQSPPKVFFGLNNCLKYYRHYGYITYTSIVQEHDRYIYSSAIRRKQNFELQCGDYHKRRPIRNIIALEEI